MRGRQKNADPDKYKYSGYGIGIYFFVIKWYWFGKNGLIFGADMSSAVHIDNKKRYILILVKCPTNSLDDTTLTAEKEYSINFTEQQKKFCLSLYYNGVNNYIFIKDVDIHKFKAKDFEINAAPLCFGNISKDFSTILQNACEQLCLYLVSISDTCISSNKIKFLKTIHRKQLISFISFKSTLMQIINLPIYSLAFNPFFGIDAIWRKKDPLLTGTRFHGRFNDPPLDDSTTMECFKIFFDDEIMSTVVAQTNLFCTQKTGKCVSTNANKMNKNSGIHILKRIVKLTAYTPYWSNNLRYSPTADVIYSSALRS